MLLDRDGRVERIAILSSVVDRMLRSYTEVLNGPARSIGGIGATKDDMDGDAMRVERTISAFSGSIANSFCRLFSRSWMCVRGSGPSPQGWVRSRRRPRPSM